jgi:DNA (cytosine-5)-methyltransferase 1
LVFQNKQRLSDLVKIESYITNKIDYLSQDYVFDKKLPVWVIYRNSFFDSIIQKLRFGIFDVFRDRCITKKHTAGHGEIRVLKSRNIQSNKIVDINDYDSFMSKGDVNIFSAGKFLNKTGCVLVPNLTYNPRACFMPEKSIADGSVAILTPKQKETKLKPKDLEYYSSEEFKKFYMIAKNYGTRSLNIDSNFVYFFGVN